MTPVFMVATLSYQLDPIQLLRMLISIFRGWEESGTKENAYISPSAYHKSFPLDPVFVIINETVLAVPEESPSNAHVGHSPPA